MSVIQVPSETQRSLLELRWDELALLDSDHIADLEREQAFAISGAYGTTGGGCLGRIPLSFFK